MTPQEVQDARRRMGSGHKGHEQKAQASWVGEFFIALFKKFGINVY